MAMNFPVGWFAVVLAPALLPASFGIAATVVCAHDAAGRDTRDARPGLRLPQPVDMMHDDGIRKIHSEPQDHD